MPIQIPLEQLLDRINIDNEWWKTGTINPFYSRMKPRAYIELFSPLVFERQIKRAVVLMGQRRIGKSVMIYHTIQQLIESGVNPKDICYISIDTPIYHKIHLEELMQVVKKHQGRTDYNGMYFFFDEIQYLKDWEIHLKSLVDTFHDTKFIVSGSAAAALKLKSRESGAGRFSDFILPPLTFYEFLELKQIEGLFIFERQHGLEHYKTNDIEKLNAYFTDYINFGGYPEVTLNKSIQADPERYIQSDIIEKVLQRDLPSLYGIDNTQELNSLFASLAHGTGNEVSMEGLSQKSNVAKATIAKYLDYLEAAFLIRRVYRIDENATKFKRAVNFKVYLTNPSLRTAFFSAVKEGDTAMGNMIETACYSQWEHSIAKNVLHYARWSKGEIDMVSLNKLGRPSWAVEFKAGNDAILAPYILFCKSNNAHKLTLTTKDVMKVKEVDGVEVSYTPSSLYCYTVGRNLIEGRLNKSFLME